MKNTLKRICVMILCVILFLEDNAAYAYGAEISDVSGSDVNMPIIDNSNDESFEDIIPFEEEVYEEIVGDVSEETEEFTAETFEDETYTIDDATYTLTYITDGEKITITGYGGEASGELKIPNEIDGYPVTSIGEYAFEYCSGFTGELIIPDSVTSIGEMAFDGCSGFDGTLTIPNSVTRIEDGTFGYCSGFTGDLTIPDSVKSIGESAFYNCSGFTGDLTIPNSVTSIGDSAFLDCSGFTGNLTIPDSVTSIGEMAFDGCSGFTGNLTIPDGVTSIEFEAFDGCSGFTGNLTIPDSVTSIGDSAFYNCSGFTGNLTIPDSVTSIGDGAFGCCSFTGELTIPDSVTSIGGCVFYGCSGFTGTLTIPDSVTSIGDNAFYLCDGFTGNLTIPNGVTSIGDGAFECCSGFTGTLTIPDSVTSIGDNAFCDCSGFTGNLTIPDSVTSIGNSAFNFCSGFTGDLKIPNSVTSIGDGAFYGCSGFDGTLTIPDGVTSIGNSAFLDCSGFTGNLTIPDSVTSIGNMAFCVCSGFTGTLTIPDSVTSIGDGAFSGCSGFKRVVNNSSSPCKLPIVTDHYWTNAAEEEIDSITGGTAYRDDYVDDDGDEDKASCTIKFSSQGGTLIESITEIPNGDTISLPADPAKDGFAFGGWYTEPDGGGLPFTEETPVISDMTLYAFWIKGETYTIDDATYTLTYITDGEKITITGYGGEASGELKIPNEIDGYPVTSIGDDAFGWCDGFTGNLTIPDSVTSIGEYAFYNCSGFDGTLTIPDSVTSIGEYAFYNCSGFTGTLTIPDSVTCIEYEAFCDCSGFTGTLTIPNSVTSIGNSAFNGCSGFTGTLTIPDSVTSIGTGAFCGCSGFTGNLTIPDSVTSIGTMAFDGCSGFTGDLTIPYGVTSIGNYAFAYCSGFDGTLTIPDSVTSIGDGVFSGCSGFKRVVNNSSSPCKLPIVTGHYWTNKAEEEIYSITAGTAYRDDYKALCIITFDSQGGTLIESITEIPKGDTISLPADPAKDGSRFGGWYTEPDGGGLLFTEETPVISDMTLYAFWITDTKEGFNVEFSESDEFSYTGKSITPSIIIYDGKTLLTKNTDYTVSYKNNTKAYTLSEGEDGFDSKKAPSITVKGKGNYSGTETVYFTIAQTDLASDDFTAAMVAVKANGKAQKPAPTLNWKGKTLAAQNNYSISYYCADESGNPEGELLASVKDEGEYVIVLTGKAPNFKGTKYVPLTVTKDKTLVSKLSVGKIANQTYTGNEIKPLLTVKNGKTSLTEGTDYTLTYSDNKNVGKASVLIEGMGDYVGIRKVNFNITGTALSKVTVEGIKSSVEYTGNDITFDGIRLYIKKTKKTDEITLTEGTDYTVSYTKNQKAGTATVTFTGINGYTGTVKKTFKITAYKYAKAPEKLTVTTDESVIYSKGGAKPAVMVKFVNGDGTVRTLTEKTDYTLSYKNNTKVNDGSDAKKLPTVKITLKGSYSGSISRNFTITAKDIGGVKLTVKDKTYQKKKNIYTSAPTLTDTDGKKLKSGTDYGKTPVYTYDADTIVINGGAEVERTAGTVVDKNDIIPAGTSIKVTVTGKSNYTGTVSGVYRITKESVTDASVKVADQIYTGSAITVDKSDITSIKVGKKSLSADDYEIVEGSYKNNIKKGTASFTIRGVGNYGGTKTVTFKIKNKVFK